MIFACEKENEVESFCGAREEGPKKEKEEDEGEAGIELQCHRKGK